MTLTWTLSAVIVVIVLMMPALMQKNFHLPPLTRSPAAASPPSR